MKQFYYLFLLITAFGFAQLTPPANLQSYYNGVDFSLTGTNLYNDLAIEIIASHTTFLAYTQRHNYLYNADEDASDPSKVILIYSGESRNENQYESGNNPNPTQTFNTEHVYPKSLLDNSNAEADLHILRSCDITINSNRGNKPFTDGSGIYKSIGSSWYPGDDWRGDVARIVMYVNLRYNEPFTDVGSLNMFLQWNAIDPVSALEDQRNAIISGVQGNRNPFIDNPYLATVIWGGSAAQNRWSALSTNDFSIAHFSMYPNPTNGHVLHINTTSVSTNLSVEIFNILGKSVLKQKLQNNSKPIDISQLNKGMYLVKLISDTGNTTKKLIKN